MQLSFLKFFFFFLIRKIRSHRFFVASLQSSPASQDVACHLYTFVLEQIQGQKNSECFKGH